MTPSASGKGLPRGARPLCAKRKIGCFLQTYLQTELVAHGHHAWNTADTDVSSLSHAWSGQAGWDGGPGNAPFLGRTRQCCCCDLPSSWHLASNLRPYGCWSSPVQYPPIYCCTAAGVGNVPSCQVLQQSCEERHKEYYMVCATTG